MDRERARHWGAVQVGHRRPHRRIVGINQLVAVAPATAANRQRSLRRIHRRDLKGGDTAIAISLIGRRQQVRKTDREGLIFLAAAKRTHQGEGGCHIAGIQVVGGAHRSGDAIAGANSNAGGAIATSHKRTSRQGGVNRANTAAQLDASRVLIGISQIAEAAAVCREAQG